MFRIGDDRVGIVTDVDGDEQTELMETVTGDPVVAWVDGCLLEIQTVSETQDVVVTATSETAYCFMPCTDGYVTTTDNERIHYHDITAGKRLRHEDGREYVMRGDAVFERGRVPHLFAQCERQL